MSADLAASVVAGPARILILTPLKDAAGFFPGYCQHLAELSYPHSAISLGFLESDSSDDTAAVVERHLPELRAEFRRVGLWRRDFGYRIPPGLARWAEPIQIERRVVLAKSRNHLLFRALDDEDWVLWLDVDVVEYPADLIERLLATGKEIVQPHCVLEYGGPTFDQNAWRDRGRLHLHDLRGEGELVELDAVGGTVLLVRADLHRDGLVFPPYLYGRESPLMRPRRGEVETEGLGMMAFDMGHRAWGMPGLEVRHARDAPARDAARQAREHRPHDALADPAGPFPAETSPPSRALPRLLYVSPAVPTSGGNGVAMRAGAVLRALAERYRLSLLVLSLHNRPDAPIPAELARLCERIARLEPDAPPPWPFADERFDVVHLFRLATLPVGRAYLAKAEWRQLDLDDLESETRRRLVALHRLNGDDAMAQAELVRAERAEALEAEALRGLDRVYVCSARDRATLAARSAAEVCVLPNVVPLRDPLPPAPADGPFTLLFVGTLQYYPNEDGVRWLHGEVLPRLRVAAPGPFRILVVGRSASRAVLALTARPELAVIGKVADLEPWYRQAHAVVVPLRAGGGTRIKVLEAFSYRRPVVSTTIGIEGIEARPGQHVLVADTPDAFAQACLSLMTDPPLGTRLAEAAHDLLTRAYTPRRLGEVLSAEC